MNNILSLGLKSKKAKKIIIRSKNIDEKAFLDLMDKYKEYLYKIAYSYVKDENLSLEIIQETTYKAYKNISNLKESSYFKTWITRILINTAISIMRNNKKFVNLEHIKVENKIQSSISTEEKIDLYNAIDLLDEKYKMIIILKYFNDMKIKDIGIIMDMPEGTVKTYLSRAKDKLCKKLGEGYMYE